MWLCQWQRKVKQPLVEAMRRKRGKKINSPNLLRSRLKKSKWFTLIYFYGTMQWEDSIDLWWVSKQGERSESVKEMTMQMNRRGLVSEGKKKVSLHSRSKETCFVSIKYDTKTDEDARNRVCDRKREEEEEMTMFRWNGTKAKFSA